MRRDTHHDPYNLELEFLRYGFPRIPWLAVDSPEIFHRHPKGEEGEPQKRKNHGRN